ncbi:MAG TPA: fumarylacetoacetate hydrolase family protein [Ramlibacter sp.]|jgi:fumarylacetoacetate (FAA) hydrolase|uniref:fumarylacetoacetate hydrolase family protein n=1 Tax=Ramlibacter sp. TaxID=1917967 RepID=UPI002D29BA4E|nr:fumarylacetoacetate hydrolase family protein [Ramlibacter sp.]HZY17790.1 fumarylacetoacetate hydrolase family protein [Ramlibacter sp.]
MTALAPQLRLATRRNGRRDGELMLVDRSARKWVPAGADAPTLQALLDDWAPLAAQVDEVVRRLDATGWAGALPFDAGQCMAPLPRAYQWADASVYRNHARLIYQWRREPIPAGYEEEPLVYQGGSDVMLGPQDDIVAVDEAHQIDLEAEIAVITGDVPLGASLEEARQAIALVVLLNDVSLRGLIPGELAKGFGFYQSKPATSFAPIAVTPAALGPAWRDGMPDLRVRIAINGEWFGEPHANTEAIFNFPQIIRHLARTRSLAAGSIVGAGTISNASPSAGSACITEARVRQILAGTPESALRPYLRDGDRVRIEAIVDEQDAVFGAIDQRVSVRPRH